MEIYDIKPIEPIVDYFFYLFVAFVIVLLLLTAVAIVAYFRNKKPNRKKEILQQLKQIDYSDAKKDAYTITTLAKELVVDEQMQQKYEQLLKMLQKYKYKKEVPPFDEKVKREFELFVGLADARI